MTPEQIEILENAILRYGTRSQLDMAVEESAELIQAINKLKRGSLVSFHGITKPSWWMELKEIRAYNDLCSEVADVKIMLAQMELMLCSERIQISVDRKISRLERRLMKK